MRGDLRAVSCVIVGLLAGGCASGAPAASIPLGEESAVLAAALEHHAERTGAPKIAVRTTTAPDLTISPVEPMVRSAGERAGANARVLDDWVERNRSPRRLAPADLPAGASLTADTATLAGVLDAAPAGSRLVTLSRPGLSPDGMRGVLMLESVCGPLCGQGVLYLLERAGDGWRVTGERVLWIS